jgi:hypothetical protein
MVTQKECSLYTLVNVYDLLKWLSDKCQPNWDFQSLHYFIILPDTDECSEKSKNKCDIKANCTNTPGSYNCLCHTGFLGNGKSCRGIISNGQRQSNNNNNNNNK